MASSDGKKGVLMVCLGNICRSPIAEAAFRDEVRKRGQEDRWFVDSCGTAGYHVGSKPDRRAIKVMEEKGVPMVHKARQLCAEDFDRFQFIFGMDNHNVSDIKEFLEDSGPAAKPIVEMLGDYDPENPKEIIRDPYYDRGQAGFELCYERCVRCINVFLDRQQGQK